MFSSAYKLTLSTTFALAATLGTVDAQGCGGCSRDAKAAKAAPAPSIVDVASSAGTFNTLLAAAKAAGLAETLAGQGPWTVFAPTDAAFDKLPKGTIPALLKDREALRRVLTYHVVPGKVYAKSLSGKQWASTVQGQSLRVEAGKSGVTVDGSRVVKADIKARNGVIHVIDSVVLPRKDIVTTAVKAGTFKNLVTAVKAADLVKVLQGDGPFTVFAPSDSAFAKLPADKLNALLKDRKALTQVLTYHVVPGRILAADINGKTKLTTVQGDKVVARCDRYGTKIGNTRGFAKIIKADIIAGNGVIHVIDSVIAPR